MSKKKAGSYKTPNIKASNLLPQVFNTDVNKKWLDSTLDQMVSKGNLKNVEGYIGDVSGNNRYTGDVYLDNTDLKPAVLVTDKDRNVTDAITADDIANAINTNFSEYNYNTAYATKSYSFRPPINIHKFIDYQKYAWVDQMPVYESVRTLDQATVGSVTAGLNFPANPSHGDYFAINDTVETTTYQWDDVIKVWQPSGATNSVYSNNGNSNGFTTVLDPVSLSDNRLEYTVTDNNNTFELKDQMLIKFVGDGWNSSARQKTYLVTGVGKGIKLIDWYDWIDNTTAYPDTTKTTVTVGGNWDKSKIITVKPNKSSALWSIHNNYDPTGMIDFYNNDPARLPIFDGFTFTSEESNPSQFIEHELICLADEWGGAIADPLDFYRIWYTTVDNVTKNVNKVLLVDATQLASGKVEQFVVPGTTEEVLAKYKDRLVGFDTKNWDKSVEFFTEKDYQVMSTDSPFLTAWSRNNKWTHIDTLRKIDELVYGGIDIESITQSKFIAKRPIIEFDGKMNLWDWADYNPTLATQWLGVIDFAVKPTGDYLPTESSGTYSFNMDNVEINAGQKILFTEGSLQGNIWQVEANGTLTDIQALEKDHCAYVREALPDTEDLKWSNSDVYYTGTNWSTGQQRTKINQMPLFKLYTVNNEPLESLDGALFAGSRIFNYKIGTSIVDTELGISLAYKDVNGIGEYQFENYLYTESYNQSITSQFNKDTNYFRPVLGSHLFKSDNRLTNLYKQSEEIAGAETLLTHDVETVSNDFTVNVGFNSWRTNRRVILHQADKTCVVTELQNGVYLDKNNVDHTCIYVGKNIPVVFNNLLETGDVKFKSADGTDFETTPTPGITITRSGDDITLSVTTYNRKIIIEPTDTTLLNSYTILPIDNYDGIQHKVEINGKHLSPNNYTINSDTIVIPKELLSVGDIVDLRYASNDNTNRTTNISLPRTLKHNPNNELVETFTMGETINHWQSIINSTPGFEGNVFGDNNYSEINKLHYFGGEIFIYSDLSIVHDALYSNENINISDALLSSGEDWDNFRNRFRSQVARSYEKKPYTQVSQLVDDVIKSLVVTRQGGDLFKTSNMAYTNNILHVQDFIIDNNTVLPRLSLKDNIHSDDNIQDHVYVYISDNYNNNGKLITRLATPGVEYKQSGNVIEFLYQPKNMPNGSYPKVSVYMHQMDTASYIPPSLTKLKLTKGYSPEWNRDDNTLTGHDGTQWPLASSANLNDMDSEYFDVVNACQFELEKRIYTGLVISDSINKDDESVDSLQYGMYSKFIPNATRETWYTLDTLNDILYKSFSKWKIKNNKTETEIPYDVNNVDTWNFSTTYVGGRFGTNVIPGHWKGAYEVLFGTSTPHTTPWHMLGYAFKPTWWDDKYSWTDATKRAALIDALKRGLVSNSRQDVEWANHLYDWDNDCPVDNFGELISQDLILGEPQDIDKAKRFEFGDYAGLEYEWRSSASGQASLIDAIVKLNPTKASSMFYSPTVKVTRKDIDYLASADLNIYTSASVATPDQVYKRVVSDVNITGIDQFREDTFVKLVGAHGSIDADVSLAFDYRTSTTDTDGVKKYFINGASLSHRGRNLTSMPAIYTNFTPAQIATSTVTFSTKEVAHVESGIVQSLHNYKLRSNLNYNIDDLHNNVDTRLSTQLRGFSSKHLLDFKTQTFDTNEHTLGENDFELTMYQSTPINVAIASSITVEYLAPGWKISGQGYGKQEFRFYEPDKTNSTSYKNVKVLDTEVKKYDNFAPTDSILEYNTTLSKIQDVYSFIRGYYYYLESIGFEFPYSGDSVAVSFVKWALTNPSETKTFDLGTNFKFSPLHGNVLELNTSVYKENTVADLSGASIEAESLAIDRVDNVLSLETKDNTVIGSAGFVVVEYEHLALLNDKTTFGVIVNDDVKNVKQDKILFRGLITDKWDGNKRAPGYLVFDNKIVENFDSSVQAVDDYYRTDGIDFNPAIRKLEDITIGNSNNELTISGGEFDSITKRNYFQGLLKQKGTSTSLDKIERKYITDQLDVKVHEQYMLSRSYFGNTERLDAVEFTLENHNFETSPQGIKFQNWKDGETQYGDVLIYAPGDKRFVNPAKTINAGNFVPGKTYTIATPGTTDFTTIGASNNVSGTTFTATGAGLGDGTATLGTAFATTEITDIDVSNLTAGSVLIPEVKYRGDFTNNLKDQFIETADYANIETWANNVSYKINQKVRYQGQLYQCAVANTTVNTKSDNIEISGVTVLPSFDYGTVATIDGVSTTFETTSTSNNTIDIQGSVQNPVITAPTSSTTLVIDGVSVGLTNVQEVPVVTGPASVIGDIINPSLSDVTGKSITVNGTPIDFDTTPADITENFTGVDNGVAPTVDLEDTFTIAQDIVSTPYFVESVTVSGTATTAYSVAGQTLTFNSGSEPADGAPIVVTIAHTPESMTASQIVSRINTELSNAGIDIVEGNPNAIFADLESGFSRLRIRYWSQNAAQFLTIGSGGTANTDLGFEASGEQEATPAVLQNIEQDIDLDTLVAIIANTNGLSHVTPSNNSGFLRLISAGGRPTLTVGGSQRTVLGLLESYTASTSTVQAQTPLSVAVTEINAALVAGGITGVTVTSSGNVLNITSTNNTLTLPAAGDSFLNQAGISESGIVNKISDDTLDNTFIPAEWTNISQSDPALFNIWISDDSDYEVNSINGVKTKHNGWNVFQAMSKGLYTADLQNNPTDEFTKDTPCGICAGKATSDGNDAEVTTNIDHGLVVGDYVMILNSTTTPSIDGIHKVTKIGSGNVFYVDQYIDACGSASSILPIRSVRFESIEDRNSALGSVFWNTPPGAYIWTDYDNLIVDGRTRSINVFQSNYPVTGGSPLTGEGYVAGYLNQEVQNVPSVVTDTMTVVRRQYNKIINKDLDNITVYDYENNQPLLDLELFDPMRGIIPGIADAEIDVKSVHDVAVYNVSTDENYEIDEDNAWGEESLGKRWWDTSKVRYYEYDQGDIKDKIDNWGKQPLGSEVVVWEWTKSSVAPDDYAEAVRGKKEMYGVVASGTAFSYFDIIKNQNEYSYTLRQEWNSSTSKYEDVYYFWVRNKETIASPDKNIITSEVENIITDPSANGIHWFSVVDNDAIVISNIWDYVNKKVVIQLNKKSDNNHQQWILLGKESDIIPTYWYTGLKSNLAHMDENDLRLPDFTNHAYARYGDDRANRQAWWDDIVSARLNALDISNRLLTSVNVYNDFRTKFTQALVEYNIPRDTWEWSDYITDDHNFASTYATTVSNIEELNALDTSEYQTARIEILDDDNVERTEYYRYTDTGWVLSKKDNATIKWLKERLAKSYAWDMEPWDSIVWSNTAIAEWWKGIVTILRETIFINEHTPKFNRFFFGMVDFAMSRGKQVDWAMKTSYVRLEVKSDLVQKKKYKKDSLTTIEGYVNDVKPFHVKISETNRTFNKLESVYLDLEAEHKATITVKADNNGANFDLDIVDANNVTVKNVVMANNGTRTYTIPKEEADMTEWTATKLLDGGVELVELTDYFIVDQTINFVTEPTSTVLVVVEFDDVIELQGGDANTVYTEIVDGGDARQPHLFTTADNGEIYRSTEAHIRPQTATMITVQTNRTGSTDAADTKTFAYLLDIYNNEHVFGLEETKTSTLSADLLNADTTISVTDVSKFTNAEYVLINNELVRVAYHNSALYVIHRGLNGTLSNKHTSGSRIVDVTNNAVYYMDPPTDRRFNDDGTTLLDSSVSAEAVLLDGIGKGTIL